MDFHLATSDDLARAGFGGSGIFVGSPGGVNSTVIRKVLHDTFGPPNCYTGDNSTWEWVVKTEQGLLAIYKHKGGWSIGYRGSSRERTKSLDEEASKLVEAVLEEAAKVKVTKQQIKDGKIGGVITNPYALFESTADRLVCEARNVITEIEETRKKKKDTNSLLQSLDRESDIGALYRSAFLMSLLSLEGFINVIYLLFLNDRYRNEFFERTLRNEMLPKKLLEIDKYCNDFPSPVITMDADLFKAFQYLTNIRNDFVHANIISDMESHYVEIGSHRLMVENKKERKFGINTHPGRINNIDVERTQRLVEKMVVKILSALDERIRYAFAVVHRYPKISYLINSDGKVLIPLREDDFVPKDAIEGIFNMSYELDDAYYAVDEDEFEFRSAFE